LLHPDWSRALPQPLLIPDVMILATLADARELMRHLPEDRRSRSTWRQVAADIEAAAAGGDIDDTAIGLPMVLMLEGHRRMCRGSPSDIGLFLRLGFARSNPT
jgi:hypothetical protein